MILLFLSEHVRWSNPDYSKGLFVWGVVELMIEALLTSVLLVGTL